MGSVNAARKKKLEISNCSEKEKKPDKVGVEIRGTVNTFQHI